MNTAKERLNPRMTFWKCGACSNAMFHLLDHEFDNVKLSEEKAADMLAGGIAQKGEQCGMLWGGSLAIGTECYRRYKDKNLAIAKAINASKKLSESFQKRTESVNCRDVAKVDWQKKGDLALYLLKVFAQGVVFSDCFNLISKWTPEAIQAAKEGLDEELSLSGPCLSCATEVLKKMNASEEESIMVAGFAGGIGLSGNGCGALAGAIWYTMLKWVRNNPDKSPSMFNNPEAKRILDSFFEQSDGEILCEKITDKKFFSNHDHYKYISGGGCKEIIKTLASA